ncbi:MAG: YifB family Mg chelatase-like AAA ATPase [Candidatus Yanofskybacteria bacterium]|nr:YifB family Mg chelatase-like AAA ATPase [Candidatus Yanofskybacteria bacterium]
MSVRIFSAAIQGIEALPIEVELDSTPGLHIFNIVGLPDKAVQESKDRIAAAIRNSGFMPPNAKNKRIIVNLAPADLKKEGPAYDLPIALGYLLESQQLKFIPDKKLFAGELSLDGSLKHTYGILSMAMLAKNLGFEEIIVPDSNVQEAAAIPGVRAIGVKNLSEAIGYLNGTIRVNPVIHVSSSVSNELGESPLLFLKGQETAKRALAIAAAGGHNLILNGPPGSGKTILAQSLRELLPPLSLPETLEVARIYSSVGLMKESPLSLKRPFRNPHHTTSAVAIIGGGTIPKPGEISLAHRGVLFLDELPEFPRNVLESLRQPLEDGLVTVARAAGTITLPAKFMLVAAMNPCPCGNFGDTRDTCVCPPFSVIKYRKKISGPLLDRLDIQLWVPRETTQGTTYDAKTVEKLKDNILKARSVQSQRFENQGIITNSEINYKTIEKFCPLHPKAEALLSKAIDQRHASLRAYHKVKKLARTIADLEATDLIQEQHVAEAISLRMNEKAFLDTI